MSGTVTFLFSDIEGSTGLLKRLGRERYGEVLARHQVLLREAFAAHRGQEIDTQGDSFFVAFRSASDAVAAAIAIQRSLADHEWPAGADVRVRIGIHSGEAAAAGERYVGFSVHRAARIGAVAHGGQVLLSSSTRELVEDDLPNGVYLRDLGSIRLKDVDRPERIAQVTAEGLQADFPPLRGAELVKPPPLLRRRSLVAATLAGVIAAAAAIPVFALGGGAGGSEALAGVGANAVGVIDGSSDKIHAQIAVGEAPGGISIGAGALWVSNSDGGTVSRIDPKTNTVRQTIPIGAGPAGIAVGNGAVWVANGLDGTVSRIDTGTNQVVQTISVGNGPAGVTFGDEAVWVANSVDGTISRIDPHTGRVTRTTPAAVGATDIAVAFDRVWAVSPSAGTLVSLDPENGSLQSQIGVGVDPEAVAAGAGSMWVANRASGTVSKIDLRTGAVTDTIQVGRSPDAIAADARNVWVANGADGTLSRIDPRTDTLIKTVSLANPPEGLALTPGFVYVAVRSSGVQHRGGTLRIAGVGAGPSIDLTACCDHSSAAILPITNDGLVAFRRVGGVGGTQLVPDLAVSLPTPTDGGRTYTFTLRTGIRYSNGRVVEPQDVRSELERLFESKNSSFNADYYSGIVGAAACHPGKPCDLSTGIAVDPVARTITFHLTAPDPDFLAKLAWPAAFAVPTGTPPRDFGAHPLPATGPYMIAAYDPKKGTVRLVRNPRFQPWSQDAQPGGFPDSIVLQGEVHSDVTAEIRAVERRQADAALSLAPPLSKQQLETLATNNPSQLRISTQFATRYFFLNTRVPPFDDVRVRRAVNLAFDRRKFVRLLGPAYAPTCQILPPGFPAYHRACPYESGPSALTKARSLTRASGRTGEAVTVWMPGRGSANQQGRFMVSVLDSLGFRAHLKLIPLAPDTGEYFNKIVDSRTRAQIGYIGWQATYPSDFSFLHEEFACSSFLPASAQNGDPSEFCDRRIDNEMAHATAVQAQNPAAAVELWQKVEHDLLAAAPTVPTYNARNVDFIAKRVGNYIYNPQWGVLLDQLWVK